jgi:hypothetical protein
VIFTTSAEVYPPLAVVPVGSGRTAGKREHPESNSTAARVMSRNLIFFIIFPFQYSPLPFHFRKVIWSFPVSISFFISPPYILAYISLLAYSKFFRNSDGKIKEDGNLIAILSVGLVIC